MKRYSPLAVVLMMVPLWAGSSYAVTTTFTDLALWEAAAGSPIVVEDFADATLVPGFSITFGTQSGSTTGSIAGGEYTDKAPCGVCVPTLNTTPVLNFSPGTTAFGADWDLSPGGPGFGINLSIGDIYHDPNAKLLATIANPLTGGSFVGFFGFVSDTPITSITLVSGLTGSGETFDMDNARFRSASTNGTVPEPTSLLLTCSGILVIAGVRKKHGRKLV